MFDSKILDTLIKAPLWIFLALTLTFGAPLLDLPILISAGLSSRLKIAGLPCAFFFIAFAALFISSAAARSSAGLVGLGQRAASAIAWRFKFMRLTPQARAVMCVAESDAADHFYLLPGDPAIEELRDKGLIVAELVGDDRTWGRYRNSALTSTLMRRHRTAVRRRLKSSNDDVAAARDMLDKAERSAKGLRPSRY